MAVTNTNSNLITAYNKKERIRTTTYRGSLLITTARVNNTSFPGDDAGSVLYLTLIPFMSSLKFMRYMFSANLTGTALRFQFGIAGINPDGTFTNIKDNIGGMGVYDPTGAANTLHTVSCLRISDKTIYELLCTDKEGYTVPIDEFEPYRKSKYGVLYIKSTEKHTSTLNSDFIISIQFVEGSPSSSLLTAQSSR